MLVSTLVQALIILVGLPTLVYLAASIRITGGNALANRRIDLSSLDRRTRKQAKRNLRYATGEILNYEFSKFLAWYVIPFALLFIPRSANTLPEILHNLGPLELNGPEADLYPTTTILGLRISKRSYLARLVHCLSNRGQGALEIAKVITARILPLETQVTQMPMSRLSIFVSKGAFEFVYQRDVYFLRYVPFLNSLVIRDEYHYGYSLTYDPTLKLNYSYPVARSMFIAFKWIPRK